MFCGNCGKKIHDDMLYCPFCGKAVVVPDQEDDTEDHESGRMKKPVSTADTKRKPRKTISLFDETEYGPEPEEKKPEAVADVEEPPIERKPIELKKAREEENADETKTADMKEDTDTEAEDAYDDDYDDDAYDDDTPEEAYDDAYDDEGDATSAPKESRFGSVSAAPQMHRRGNGTYIPVRQTRSEDMFLGTEEDEEDDYDDYDEYDDDGGYGYDSEPPKKSFFKRHAAALIAICTVLILAIGIGVFACLPAGQKILARVNLAWSADAYAAVGYAEYQSGKYAESANYYVKAFEKDKENYEYAHSAMVAYYDAEDIDNAAQMAIACIDLKPDDPEPYRELLSIYANADMPTMVRDYIQQGYRNTGDSYLDPNNWVTQ